MSQLMNRLLGLPMKESKALNEEVRNESLAAADVLNEVLIQFGGRKQTQFGQVVIMAGGAGSGKGFVLDNLVDIQGRVFDVDAMKKLALKTPGLIKRVKQEFGVDMTELNLKNPDNVSKLHAIIDDLGVDKSLKRSFFNSVVVADPSRKPNIIFDVTLKSLSKLRAINEMVTALGYKKENIHIVWVLNDINVALKQNAKRDRVVPEDILKDTHDLVSREMANILKGKTDARKYMDGLFVIVPNKAGIDSDRVTRDSKSESNLNGKPASYLRSADYIVVKKRGRGFEAPKKLGDRIIQKIRSYVPDPVDWVFEMKSIEIVKTSTEEAIEFAKSVLPDLDKILPNFARNYDRLKKKLDVAKFKREDMPVIRSKDYDAFQRFLDSKGVNYRITKTPVHQLVPSQNQVFLNQIVSGIEQNGLSKSIKWVSSQSLFIVSQEGFIIDGHHRYSTGMLLDGGIQVRILRINLPMQELLKVSLDFSDNVAGNKRNKAASGNRVL